MSYQPPGLTISLLTNDNAVVLFLRGEADISTTGVVQEALARLRESASSSVIIDLADLEFIDVRSSRTLAAYCDTATRHGQHTTIRGASGLHPALLELSHLRSFVA